MPRVVLPSCSSPSMSIFLWPIVICRRASGNDAHSRTSICCTPLTGNHHADHLQICRRRRRHHARPDRRAMFRRWAETPTAPAASSPSNNCPMPSRDSNRPSPPTGPAQGKDDPDAEAAAAWPPVSYQRAWRCWFRFELAQKAKPSHLGRLPHRSSPQGRGKLDTVPLLVRWNYCRAIHVLVPSNSTS